MDLVHRIVTKIAAREGRDPLALEHPLHAADAAVVEALDRDAGAGRDGESPVVTFPYCGYTVRVDGNRTVSVSEGTGSPDRESSAPPNGSVDARAAELDRRETAIRRAADVIGARERPFADRLDGVLEIVRKTLDLEAATLSYVNDDAYVFEAVDAATGVDGRAGSVVPLAETVCKRAVETEQALTLHNVAVDAPALADSTTGVSAYIGVPVFVDGEVYGTFCCYDSEPRAAEFSDWALPFVELLSRWVSSELERRRQTRALQACSTDRPSSV